MLLLLALILLLHSLLLNSLKFTQTEIHYVHTYRQIYMYYDSEISLRTHDGTHTVCCTHSVLRNLYSHMRALAELHTCTCSMSSL